MRYRELYICVPCGSEHSRNENIRNKGKCRFCSTKKKLIRIN
jgi:hypothetical protein